MVLTRRSSIFLKLLAVVIVGWAGLVSPSPADAHGSIPYVSDGIVSDGSPVAGESERMPGAKHEDERHCHGGSSVCHYQIAMYSGLLNRSLRSVVNLTGHVPVLRKDRDIIPPHRPPRDNRHLA